DEDDDEDDGPATTTPALKFDNADGQFLLDAYAKETGQTLLIAPDIPKVQGITLRSQKGLPLTRDEYLEAIEITLGMNGIVLEPYGDKFLKVLPRKTIRVEGIKINMEKPEGGYPEKNKVISQMIQLKAITIDEAQKALEGFKRPDGLIQAFERTNSLLVTDTQENINRMLEVVKFIDQPLVATEEVNVRVIKYAKAEEIKKRLEEIVAESQKQNSGSRENIQMNRSGAPGISRQTQNFQFNNPTMRPGLTRLGQPQQTTPQASANENISTLVSDADRGMIRGKVQVISDERSNQLIIITQKENMDFFDKIITVLDIETDPDVEVKVRRLDYAIAKDVTDMLNELIGNSSSRNDQNNTANNTQGSAGANNGRSQSLSDLARARAGINNTPAANNSVNNSAKAKLGQLSKDNIKIIQDERNNAIVMMGSPADLKALGEVIDNLDIPRLQVLIETVVLQVELGDDIKTGIDWVQRGKHKVKEAYTYTTADGETATGYRWITTRDTIFNNGDQLGGGGGTGSSLLGGLLNLGTTVATNATEEVGNLLGARTGISYFLKSDKLNIAALIEASKSDSRTKVLSSPVLMTMDNQEATIEATSMRYLYKGVRYSGSSYNGSEVPDYEQRDIGLRVTITPRINPNGAVVLTIDESFETIGANQTVGTESYPTVNKRSLKAEVSVENMQTVVLGGLVQNELKKEETGIPILKDIPLIGKYLFGTTSSSDSRSELLVFLTPYVFNDAKDLTAEAMRRKAALSDDRPWIDYGWSRSKLADPVSHDEKMRRLKQRWANEDSEHNAELLYQKALKAREEQLAKRDAEEREKGIALPPKDDPEKTDNPDLPQQAVGDVGILTTTDTTEVLKLNGGDNRPQPPPDAETAAPAKKKSWWKFW
ncbi:MAG: type II secretion system secretin GspD, partial [Kiritimatiellae bacterium]|nr:type II secretion system secretin GspD [Kiritimatiellia bacterium]